MTAIPTAGDVVAHLNERFRELGIPHRIEYLAVLPYMNPMWLANWSVPQLDEAPEKEAIEKEIREARWLFPQILDEY